MIASPARHLYIHVPFCTRRCSYCSFAIAVRRLVPVRDYVDAVMSELGVRLRNAPAGSLDTLYFGGGTPSKLGPDGIAMLVDRVRTDPGIELESAAEVTLEANPEDVTTDAASAWLAAGVTRLSLGIQSFDRGTLAWMHRTHDVEGSRRAVAAARDAGFANVSIDLIFGLPSALERDWANDLEQAMALEPDHVSLYGLTVEPHTALGKWTARGEVTEAPEERYAAEFLLARAALTGAGFEHYEVSNYARPGRRSVHNSAYWRRVPYLGVGPSAHSFDGVERRWNEPEFEAWKAKAHRGEDPVAGWEALTAANEVAETVYLGLRTSDGLRLLPGDHPTVEGWAAEGWTIIDEGRQVLTAEGWLRLDSLSATLTARRSR